VVPTIPVEEERKDRFEAVYLDHHASIYAYVHRRLAGMGAEVHDVVAEVFEVAWRRLDELPDPPEDRLWLFGVARRCVLRAHRSGRRRRRLQARLSDVATVLSNGQTSDERGAVVRAAIERLRPREREVVQLVMWDGLTHAEASRVLGCSPNAVAVRLHKARKRLQAELSTSEGAER
jgi:RNA polymerase sigma factor (sigma-70 family)